MEPKLRLDGVALGPRPPALGASSARNKTVPTRPGTSVRHTTPPAKCSARAQRNPINWCGLAGPLSDEAFHGLFLSFSWESRGGGCL